VADPSHELAQDKRDRIIEKAHVIRKILDDIEDGPMYETYFIELTKEARETRDLFEEYEGEKEDESSGDEFIEML
jgi:hypothetical protein